MPIKTVSIIVDREKRDVTPGLVQGQDLINLAGITAPEQLLLEISGDIDVPVSPTDVIFIRGNEQFSIGDGSPPIEDNPSLRHPIHFRFNNQAVSHDKLFARAKVTVEELKHLDPNLQPGDMLVADLQGLADEVLKDDVRIILQQDDQFITVPCGNVGFEDLITQQLEEVKATFPAARLDSISGNRYLVVENFPIPNHFSAAEVTLLTIIPNGFPMSAPDMFWVDPPLKLTDGREPEGGGIYEHHLDRSWQRFSWHYTNGHSAWRVGRSNMLTHIQFCQARLALAK